MLIKCIFCPEKLFSSAATNSFVRCKLHFDRRVTETRINFVLRGIPPDYFSLKLYSEGITEVRTAHPDRRYGCLYSMSWQMQCRCWQHKSAKCRKCIWTCCEIRTGCSPGSFGSSRPAPPPSVPGHRGPCCTHCPL